MRIIKCDVCDEDYGPEDPMIEMVIPAYFMDQEGPSIRIDVCSWECLDRVSRTPHDIEHQEDQEEEVTPPEQFIDLPPTPTIDVDMTEKMLAEYTEAVTGVKRRG